VLKIRVIPVLFLMNGLIVRSEKFEDFKVIGNPLAELERYSEWLADELVYIDITREGGHDIRRDDHKTKNIGNKIDILRAISSSAYMPLTFGGRISTLDEIDSFLANGADKVLVNSLAWSSPEIVAQAVVRHGAQAIMAGIDFRRVDGKPVVFVGQGSESTGLAPDIYARRLAEIGVGEILINAIDRDGTAEGYDLDAIRSVVDAVTVPVIACGGAGNFGDFRAALDAGHASAVAAGNLFHFTENAYKRAKMYLKDRGYPVRDPYSS
jgi:imidazole glycerol-phosphate synthase subunit HisF